VRGHQDDDVAWGSDRRGTVREHGSRPGAFRTYGLIGGFVLAVAATAVVFLTDDPQYLRLAVVAAAWAFVLAAVLAGRRRAEAQAAAAREGDIRRSYEYELDREAAAHREHELEIRREADESMAAELTALRGEVAELNLLKHEVARVARLGTDLPQLSGLRAEIASLTGLRDDLAQLAELRTEMGRLRAELTEQLNGEMLIERIMLRTQSIRPAADGDAARTVEAAPAWDDERPRELTGGRPAVGLDELPETRRPEPVPVERPAPAPPPATTAFPLPNPSRATSRPATPPPAHPQPPTPLEWLADRSLVEPEAPGSRRSRHAADELDDVPAHQFSGAPAADVLPPLPPRRRRTDDPVDDRTTEHPVAPATSYEPIVRPSPTPRLPPMPTPPAGPPTAAVPVVPDEEPQTAGHERLEQILADSGGQPPSGGRRRRRYREDDEPDDVLARVLGRDSR
jgi:hypothetical protein